MGVAIYSGIAIFVAGRPFAGLTQRGSRDHPLNS